MLTVGLLVSLAVTVELELLTMEPLVSVALLAPELLVELRASLVRLTEE